MRSLLAALCCAALFAGCPSSPGPQGPEGPAGPQGATGPQGPVGAKGDDGAIGPMGATGAQGPAGPQGIQGPAGTVLVLDGGVVVGPPGSSVVVTPVAPGGQPCPTGGVRITQVSDGGISHVCNGALTTLTATTLPAMSTQCATGGVLINLPDGGAFPVCNGTQGPIGATGPQGPQGNVGPLGPQGPQGMIGPTGPQGPQGMTGGTGPQGPQGNVGPAGPQGPQGMTGGAGPQGPQGVAGPTGPAGATGPMGPPGAVLYLDGGVVLTELREARPVLVGYTTFTSNGAIGSRTAANARCSSEFPNTHLCTQTEFRLSRTLLAPPSPGAFLDYAASTTSNDPDVNVPCNNFTFTGLNTYSAAVALPSGITAVYSSSTPNCSSTMPLACCTSPSYVRLRGYTAFTTTGNIGGRLVANARCHAEFPGSHLCNQTEFRHARSITTLPAIGAFLDYSASTTSTDPDVNVPCNNFSFASINTYSAAVALPSGVTAVYSSSVPNCSSTLPLACCD